MSLTNSVTFTTKVTLKHEHAFVSQTLQSGNDLVVASVNENPHCFAMVHTWFRYWLCIERKRVPSIDPILLAFDVPIGRISEKWSYCVLNRPISTSVASLLAQALKVMNELCMRSSAAAKRSGNRLSPRLPT
jgi:hypothetical protein